MEPDEEQEPIVINMDYPAEYSPPPHFGCIAIGSFVLAVFAFAFFWASGAELKFDIARFGSDASALISSVNEAPRDSQTMMVSGGWPHATAAPSPNDMTFDGATVLYSAPVSERQCSALGAIEAGRSVEVVERRGDWTLINAQGSGRVWTNDRNVRNGNLVRPIVAFSRPDDGGCAIIGIASPGEPYRVIRESDGWLIVVVNDTTAWIRK